MGARYVYIYMKTYRGLREAEWGTFTQEVVSNTGLRLVNVKYIHFRIVFKMSNLMKSNLIIYFFYYFV